MLRRSGRGRSKQISRDDQVGVGPANAARRLLGHAARPHIADFTTDAGQAEAALRFLAVEPIERDVESKLFGAQKRFANGRIGRFFENVALRRERFTILRDRLRIIADERRRSVAVVPVFRAQRNG